MSTRESCDAGYLSYCPKWKSFVPGGAPGLQIRRRCAQRAFGFDSYLFRQFQPTIRSQAFVQDRNNPQSTSGSQRNEFPPSGNAIEDLRACSDVPAVEPECKADRRRKVVALQDTRCIELYQAIADEHRGNSTVAHHAGKPLVGNLALRAIARLLLQRDIGGPDDLAPLLDIGGKHLRKASELSSVMISMPSRANPAFTSRTQATFSAACSFATSGGVLAGCKNADPHHQFHVLDAGFRHRLHVRHTLLTLWGIDGDGLELFTLDHRQSEWRPGHDQIDVAANNVRHDLR